MPLISPESAGFRQNPATLAGRKQAHPQAQPALKERQFRCRDASKRFLFMNFQGEDLYSMNCKRILKTYN